MFSIDGNKVQNNDVFFNTTLSEMYEPIVQMDLSGKLSEVGEFNFPNPFTYHSNQDGTFLPELDGTTNPYKDIVLGDIKIPDVLNTNGIDLSFKYDYTIIPCMNFGKLDHLAVSNTVDFSNLHAFNKSDFNIWKYRIDGNQLRLTFGAEIFDTYENDKVDALVLEFYDLRGFAGSLEIVGKKSYTGMFTKILSLNELGTLSNKKISGNKYVTTYAKNVNIFEDSTGNFTYAGKPVNYVDSEIGWAYDDDSPLGDGNDCGVIYSNLLYGVKTYLRRTINIDGVSEFEFIPKKEMFLYTFPIYNDYFYSVENFNALEYPKIDMVLTYRLEDLGDKTVLTQDTITNGYCPGDNEKVSKYLTGNYRTEDSTSFDVVRYYKYKGESKLNLEVGLKQEYEKLNIRYDVNVINYFSCDIKLISDDSLDRNYTVKLDDSYVQDYNQVLNYYDPDNPGNTLISLESNKLGFGSNYSSKGRITDIQQYGFLNCTGNNYIPICYEFVVGYKASISNIRPTRVPATTVCALYHQNDAGEYNESDFGIYINTNDAGEKRNFSYTMFYNDGDITAESFGLAKQVSSDTTVPNSGVCSMHLSSNTATAIERSVAGKMNTQFLKDGILEHIGKLSFCVPHIHGIEDACKVSVWKESSMYYAGDCVLDKGKVSRFNLVACTNAMFDYNQEFISAVCGDYKTGSNTIAEFSSVDAKQLEVFNTKLLKTMSNVYAYNPDYDFINVNAGDVITPKNTIKFVSNLVSENAKFEFDEGKTLNDYIYIGPVCFTKYLNNLNSYSDDFKVSDNGIPVPQVHLVPNYTFCGGEKEPYLVSSITYNTPTPVELSDELGFTASDIVLVKHSDGRVLQIKGDVNKKTLYGFIPSSNQLINLDVANYTIKNDGSLSIVDTINCGT